MYSEIVKEGEGRWKMEGEEYMNRKSRKRRGHVSILIITRHSKRVTSQREGEESLPVDFTLGSFFAYTIQDLLFIGVINAIRAVASLDLAFGCERVSPE